jgi:hypothetical protein
MRLFGAFVALLLGLAIAIHYQPWAARMSTAAAEREVKAKYAADADAVSCRRADVATSFIRHDEFACVVTYDDGRRVDWSFATSTGHLTVAGP